MHHGGNDHGRRDQGWIWLLAGTAEGVAIAAALIRSGWTVEVSVVTASAARAYADLAVAALHQGPLDGDASIEQVLARRPSWVVDATHPFALQISAALHRVCGREGQRLLRFERRTDVLSRTGSASADVPASVRGNNTEDEGPDDIDSLEGEIKKSMHIIGKEKIYELLMEAFPEDFEDEELEDDDED